MNIIPNVYQAAYMEGLTKKNGGKVFGIFGKDTGEKLYTKTDIRDEINRAKFLQVSSLNQYEFVLIKKGEERQTYTVPKSSNAIDFLRKEGLQKFPKNSIRLNSKHRNVSTEVGLTKTSLTNFLDTQNPNSVKVGDTEIFIERKAEKILYTNTTDKLFRKRGYGNIIEMKKKENK